MSIDRRALLFLIEGAGTVVAGVSRAQPPAVSLRPGWTVDLSACPPDRLAAVTASLGRQIDIVEAVPMSEAVKTEFRAIPLIVVTGLGEPGRYEIGRLRLNAVPQPQDNPVLLHELMHAWHVARQADATVTGPIRRAYAAARASGDFPAQSYMMSNPREFFAMCASTVLWGRAAREPFTRERVRQALPALCAFIVERFGLRL